MLGLSPTHLIVIVIAGLLIFGPDKLPKMAADAGKMIRQLRRMADDVRTDLKEELGDTIGDLDLKSFTPRGLVQKHLLDPALDEVEDVKRSFSGVKEELHGAVDMTKSAVSGASSAPASLVKETVPAGRTPYDDDAT